MKVIRKDGIQYERDKDRDKKYDCSLNIRFDRSELEKLKELANREGIKYNALVRKLIVEYIKFKESGDNNVEL